jgi:hypothetical protein
LKITTLFLVVVLKEENVFLCFTQRQKTKTKIILSKRSVLLEIIETNIFN